MSNNNNLPIGVFDSGVGGLSVVKAMKKELPNESIIYLGDSARVPYGTKSPETVIKYSLKNADFLVSQKIKMLVVACNTASAHSLPALREKLDIPVVGVVVPGANAALNASINKIVGIIGTLGTIRSGIYENSLKDISESPIKTAGKACALFVPLADEGWVSGEVPRLIANRYLNELKGKLPDLDVIILGCTHYPMLRDTIQESANEIFSREIKLIDSGKSAAKTVNNILKSENQLNLSSKRGYLKVFVTDSTRVSQVGSRFLGEPVGYVHRVDIT
jgi:glutamate racemase